MFRILSRTGNANTDATKATDATKESSKSTSKPADDKLTVPLTGLLNQLKSLQADMGRICVNIEASESVNRAIAELEEKIDAFSKDESEPNRFALYKFCERILTDDNSVSVLAELQNNRTIVGSTNKENLKIVAAFIATILLIAAVVSVGAFIVKSGYVPDGVVGNVVKGVIDTASAAPMITGAIGGAATVGLASLAATKVANRTSLIQRAQKERNALIEQAANSTREVLKREIQNNVELIKKTDSLKLTEEQRATATLQFVLSIHKNKISDETRHVFEEFAALDIGKTLENFVHHYQSASPDEDRKGLLKTFTDLMKPVLMKKERHSFIASAYAGENSNNKDINKEVRDAISSMAKAASEHHEALKKVADDAEIGSE